MGGYHDVICLLYKRGRMDMEPHIELHDAESTSKTFTVMMK